jgi:hypothetical protein
MTITWCNIGHYNMACIILEGIGVLCNHLLNELYYYLKYDVKNSCSSLYI